MKLALRLNIYDKLAELLIWSVIAGHFLYICLHYQSLPKEIPLHFDLKGKADAFGNKSNICLLPFISLLLVTGMTILNRFPHKFNYLTPVTPDNALQKYMFATRLIRSLKLMVAALFLFVTTYIISMSVGGNANGLGSWIFAVIMIVPMLVLPGYLLFERNKH